MRTRQSGVPESRIGVFRGEVSKRSDGLCKRSNLLRELRKLLGERLHLAKPASPSASLTHGGFVKMHHVFYASGLISRQKNAPTAKQREPLPK